jgi:hypothetical protein
MATGASMLYVYLPTLLILGCRSQGDPSEAALQQVSNVTLLCD